MKCVLIADDLREKRALCVTSLALAGFVVAEAADDSQVIDVVVDPCSGPWRSLRFSFRSSTGFYPYSVIDGRRQPRRPTRTSGRRPSENPRNSAQHSKGAQDETTAHRGTE